ncbi:MAG: hypothetical protein KDE22_13385, partial [Rhodobacterales bacterium]|nr:hypothetical protein [Rhodobacterales bacterium]
MSGFVRHRVIYVNMDVFDDALFTLALRDAFPTLVIHRTDAYYRRPDLGEVAAIEDHALGGLGLLVPPPGWRPVFEPREGVRDMYVFANPPHDRAKYIRTTWDDFQDSRDRAWVCDPPTTRPGTLTFGPCVGSDAEKAFQRTFLGVLNRLTVNRYKEHDYTGAPLLMKDAPRRAHRIGIHAMTWAQAAPRRMLEGRFRPCDDWEPRKSDWYRDLEERVKARYGPGFG